MYILCLDMVKVFLIYSKRIAVDEMLKEIRRALRGVSWDACRSCGSRWADDSLAKWLIVRSSAPILLHEIWLHEFLSADTSLGFIWCLKFNGRLLRRCQSSHMQAAFSTSCLTMLFSISYFTMPFLLCNNFDAFFVSLFSEGWNGLKYLFGSWYLRSYGNFCMVWLSNLNGTL